MHTRPSLLLSLFLVFLASCSSSKKKPGTEDKERSQSNYKRLPDPPRLEALAFGNEQFPRLKKYFRADGRLERQEIDFNGDGRMDYVQYFNSTGQWVEKESADLNGDGVLEATSFYSKKPKQDPVLLRQEFQANDSGQTNVWKHFEKGELARREIDVRGSGRPDYWEYYENGRVSRIDRDSNGDGIPDSQPKFRPIGKDPIQVIPPKSKK